MYAELKMAFAFPLVAGRSLASVSTSFYQEHAMGSPATLEQFDAFCRREASSWRRDITVSTVCVWVCHGLDSIKSSR